MNELNIELTGQSERLYRHIGELVPYGIWICGTDGRVTHLSDNFLEMVGMTLEECKQFGWADRLPPEEVEKTISDWQHCIEAGDVWDYEYRIRDKYGSYKAIHSRGIPIRDEKGHIIYWTGINLNITELKRMQEDLDASRAAFMSIVEKSQDGIIIVDRDGSVLYANEAANSLFPGVMGNLANQQFGLPVVPVEGAEIDVVCPNGDLTLLEMRASDTEWNGHPALLVALRDITRQKRAEEALKDSEERMRLIIESSPIGISITQHGKRVFVNPAFVKMFGYESLDEVLKLSTDDFCIPDDRERLRGCIEENLQGKPSTALEVTGVRRNGETVDLAMWSTKINYTGGSAELAFIIDVSVEKALRAQLLQAQKMESVGTLAGGIAHDFNNLLTIIQGYSELVLASKTEEDGDYADLKKIAVAGQRGADLVRKILTFSRKVESNPRTINLNDEVQQVQGLLTRTIPKMIEIELNLEDKLRTINADPAQMEQVLLNLAVNAKDAMPEGGRLVIETRNVVLDEEHRKHLEAEPGEYVLLTVSDTGHGIEKEHLGRIFEPFYTTKKPGEGTGLGLATVFGIVKSHGGLITCYSKSGEGTTFKIYLPAAKAETQSDVATSGEMPALGTETILWVDDEDVIINLGQRILTQGGYRILTARNGEEALEIFRTKKDVISLVILDLIMPGMGGKQCLEELLKIDPNVKVIIGSGYSVSGPAKDSLEAGARGFVSKPYKVKQVLHAVRQVLDAD